MISIGNTSGNRVPHMHPAEGLLVAGMLLGMPMIDAVFFVDSDHPADQGKAHALARVNGQILDPRQPKAPLSLADVGEVYFAMVSLPDPAGVRDEKRG